MGEKECVMCSVWYMECCEHGKKCVVKMSHMCGVWSGVWHDLHRQVCGKMCDKNFSKSSVWHTGVTNEKLCDNKH